ncbi:MAG: phosphoglycerate kinase [Patescibacteria group bacterium]
MEINTLKDIQNLKSKKVLLRVDFNVPLKDNGDVQDDTRIIEALPTIKYLQEHGAKIIIISHLGRPDGQVKEELRLTKVAEYLGKLLNKEVKKSNEVLGAETTKLVSEMQDSEIVMLENIRFRPEEEKCEENFTKELASLGEIFVNDAFGTAHRKHASTAGLADYLPAYAGLLMEKEITHLSPLLSDNIKRPLTMVFGGAKIDTKIGIIKNFLKKADHFLMGGALANTFLYAKGYKVGTSLYEEDKADIAKEIMAECANNNEKFLLPTDVVVAKEISETAETQNVSVQNVADDLKILDIGEATSKKYCEVIKNSGTVIWNGPMGLCEFTPFQNGSSQLAHCLAESNCTSIIGGGDTADSLKRLGIPFTKFTHVSTGGGACIEFLSGQKLPGIEVLRKK